MVKTQSLNSPPIIGLQLHHAAFDYLSCFLRCQPNRIGNLLVPVSVLRELCFELLQVNVRSTTITDKAEGVGTEEVEAVGDTMTAIIRVVIRTAATAGGAATETTVEDRITDIIEITGVVAAAEEIAITAATDTPNKKNLKSLLQVSVALFRRKNKLKRTSLIDFLV